MSNDLMTIGLPPIFDGIVKKISDAEVVTSFPVNTFLENIALDAEGNLFVTSLEEGAVYKINADGGKEEYAKVKGRLTGIIHINAETFLINGWNENGVPSIYLLTEKQTIIPLISLPDAYFLNGIASYGNGTFLICDSYKGCIWEYNMNRNKANIWQQHFLLSRADDASPMPAANGIKIFEGTVFVSNTARQFLVKIPLNDGLAGTPELFMDKLNLDDFAFDSEGNIYAATHVYNSVVKITPQKKVTIIGEVAQGLAGSTAVAFGVREDDKNSIYVTTNGGMSLPLPEGVQEARIIKLKLNER